MNKLILAGAAALSLIAAPSLAQSTGGEVYDMTTAQQQMYMNWPAEMRIAYTQWPAELQAYYWTLTPQQQEGWWILTDDQRNRIFIASPELRAQTWTAIAAQMAATPNSRASTQPAGTTMAGNMRWLSNPVVQRIPPPHQGEYPICKSDADDNCMNPWEAGLRGPSVERPLQYWPG